MNRRQIIQPVAQQGSMPLVNRVPAIYRFRSNDNSTLPAREAHEHYDDPPDALNRKGSVSDD
jgi:hypothetical protein